MALRSGSDKKPRRALIRRSSVYEPYAARLANGEAEWFWPRGRRTLHRVYNVARAALPPKLRHEGLGKASSRPPPLHTHVFFGLKAITSPTREP
ncbi:hypothetical protein MRX96_003959 [Rhipicephalus microplus]